MPAASAIEDSSNSKIAARGENCSTTYACRSSCSDVCPFKKTKACYGNIHPIVYQWDRLNSRMSPEAIARTEAAAILQLSGRSPLRVHTLGDCRTTTAAMIIGKAVDTYMSWYGKPAWSYTHSWRTIKREAWGNMSMLASCETTAEVKQATKRGYAAVLVVDKFERNTAYRKDGLKLVPCFHMTGKAKSCVSCKFCLNDKKMLSNGVVLAIAAHGPTLRVGAALANKNKGRTSG